MENFNLKEYLNKRQRSEREVRMNELIQKCSNGKYCVEDFQMFFDTTIKPLDVLRKYEKELDLGEKECEEFMALLREVWNNTPRTEFGGKTPVEMF